MRGKKEFFLLPKNLGTSLAEEKNFRIKFGTWVRKGNTARGFFCFLRETFSPFVVTFFVPRDSRGVGGAGEKKKGDSVTQKSQECNENSRLAKEKLRAASGSHRRESQSSTLAALRKIARAPPSFPEYFSLYGTFSLSI